MNYVGVDLHKESSWMYVVDSCGKKIDSRNIANKPEIIKRYLSKIPKPFMLAVEATYNWYWFVDIAEQYAKQVYLANSYELKAFAKRHKKTDKIDARLIATVLQRGFLPVVYIVDKETRELRELLRYRLCLVKDRSRNIFRLKALLDKLGLDSNGNFTTYKGLEQISTDAHIAKPYKLLINKYRERIVFLIQKLSEIRKELVGIAQDDEDIGNLMSIYGLSYFSAALVKSEIVTIDRFQSFNRLCAYGGLAPRVSQSAHKKIHGPLNTNRRKNLQWIVLETVIHFIKASPDKTKKYLSIKKRKGHHTARVALARDMLKAIYIVLKQKRPFYCSAKEYNKQIQSVAAGALCGV